MSQITLIFEDVAFGKQTEIKYFMKCNPNGDISDFVRQGRDPSILDKGSSLSAQCSEKGLLNCW